MSLTILSVCYCVFFVTNEKMNENEKNEHFEKSSKLGGVVWI